MESEHVVAPETLERLDLEAELAKARLLARVLGESSRAQIELGRFEVLRCIGRGGMGKVFEAHDRATGARLALKTLHAARGDALERIQREFRALSSLSHPNLVAMYELHLVRDLPFFTMELVDGASLSDRLRDGPAVDGELIRSCLLQLVDALCAIHESGTVHGDVKPSNVLLRRDGTLILVDFGVACALGKARAGPASGTSSYMAPERAHGANAGAPSDWYSVGAVLGTLLAHASERERTQFTQLSLGLLAPDPRCRFGAREVQRALGTEGRVRAGSAYAQGEHAWFVARERELSALHGALSAAALGTSVCTVAGDPGLGKTALVEYFLSTSVLADALVLRGRCYEQETLPYKGFDGIAVALAAHLQRLPEPARAALVRGDLTDLCQVFPALGPVLCPAAVPARTPRDPRALRRKAFAALATLLAALAQQQRVVLFIDDLQWADADGAALLERLLLGAERPALLLIVTHRSGQTSAGLAALTAASHVCAMLCLTLQPLSAEACTELASRLSANASEHADLVRESGGNPLLLRALLRAETDRSESARSYGALVVETLERLGPAARELLELAVLAGRPVAPELLRVAANAPEHPWKFIAALHHAHLLRSAERAGQPSLTPYHDRVAETVTGLVTVEARRARHLALARAAATLSLDDPEFLADQLYRAGARSDAALHFEQAGDRARGAVALQRACEHYARALECHAPERPLGCVRKLAESCAVIGDLARAAPLHLEVAKSAPDAVSLRLKAAEMYLLSGADEAGMKLLRPALREAGIWLPASALGALGLGLLSLARIQLIQLAWRSRATAGEEADQRVEIALRIGYCIALMHPHQGAALLTWSCARAMRLGSRAQRGCALAHTAYVHTLLGLGSRAAQDARIAQALSLTCDDRVSRAFVLCADAVVSFARAECADTLRKCATADAYILAERVEEHWLLTQLQTIVASVRVMSGDFALLDAFAATLETEARELGNRAVIVQAQSARAWAGLVMGDASRMRAFAREARAAWKAERVSTLYALAIWGEGHGHLYEGEREAALRLMREEAPRFARSSLARVQPWSAAIALLWASIELACSTRARDAHGRAAEALARRLERDGTRWAAPSALLIRAGLARRQGRLARALELYAAASRGFDRLGMQSYSAAAAYRVEELSSASTPACEAVPWFRAQGVAEPAKLARMYAP